MLVSSFHTRSLFANLRTYGCFWRAGAAHFISPIGTVINAVATMFGFNADVIFHALELVLLCKMKNRQ